VGAEAHARGCSNSTWRRRSSRIGVSPDRGDQDGVDRRGQPLLGGSPQQIADDLARYRESGCERAVVMIDVLERDVAERITRFADAVLPRLSR
jgi:alkanesulfonate monooxygenase SsuD/methylene tetrahydromethanopterin reductase-like flavin-dependent oxidoreductase (luciferase family)